ncbi:tryptophan synthase beta subunit-like PLP-dependent enzyme [Chytridium lagenaria]|nr:tryptophan synthase beta subunit-like PLP-dependent enzyme [Chytridium lagenaria]
MATIQYAISLKDIKAAAERIRGKATVTPVLACQTLSDLAPKDPVSNEEKLLLFKCENFQKIGAFKFRGAYNALSSIPSHERTKGAVTHSSGNHAQAVALAAKMLDMPAYIIMPKNASKPKKAAVLGYGAKVIECEPTQAHREQTAAQVEKETGATFVHPYNNPKVMAGQGTLMLEFLQQASDEGVELDAVVIPAGGGGMLSGCAVAALGMKPSIRVFAAEPEEASDIAQGFRANPNPENRASRVHVPRHEKPPVTFADGLLTTTGDLTWPIIRDNVEDVFTVTEDEISKAMKLIWERMKLVIEPSAAVGVAAVLYSERFKKLEGIKNVGVVLCGGNLDLDLPLPWQKSFNN